MHFDRAGPTVFHWCPPRAGRPDGGVALADAARSHIMSHFIMGMAVVFNVGDAPAMPLELTMPELCAPEAPSSSLTLSSSSSPPVRHHRQGGAHTHAPAKRRVEKARKAVKVAARLHRVAARSLVGFLSMSCVSRVCVCVYVCLCLCVAVNADKPCDAARHGAATDQQEREACADVKRRPRHVFERDRLDPLALHLHQRLAARRRHRRRRRRRRRCQAAATTTNNVTSSWPAMAKSCALE